MAVIAERALDLKIDERAEVFAFPCMHDVRHGNAVACKLVEWKINAVAACILREVANDVCELKRHAQILRVFERLWITVAEDLRRQQTDYTGDAKTIKFERIEIGVAALREV